MKSWQTGSGLPSLGTGSAGKSFVEGGRFATKPLTLRKIGRAGLLFIGIVRVAIGYRTVIQG